MADSLDAFLAVDSLEAFLSPKIPTNMFFGTNLRDDIENLESEESLLDLLCDKSLLSILVAWLAQRVEASESSKEHSGVQFVVLPDDP